MKGDIVTGSPFKGERLEEIKKFLGNCGICYEEGIEYTAVLRNEEGIRACASVEGNVIKCVAVSENLRGEGVLWEVLSAVVSHLQRQGINRYFLYTKPEYRQIFKDMMMYPVCETKNLLLMESQRDGWRRYLEELKRETALQRKEMGAASSRERIGAIVLNANPFTVGHQYLVREAAKKCDELHLFVLSSENGMFTAAERMEMVRRGTRQIPGIILHGTSDYLVSPATFPEYFHKDVKSAKAANTELDLVMFGREIAPALGIGMRFVGTEQADEVTRSYNEQMKELLPEMGIEVVETERLQLPEVGTVSASKVRKWLRQGDFARVWECVPKENQEYLKEIVNHTGEKRGI